MIGSGGGVILNFGGSGDPLPGYSLGGLQTAFEALESMRKQLSSRVRQVRRPGRDAAHRRRPGVDPAAGSRAATSSSRASTT